jgi:hypothetical protein
MKTYSNIFLFGMIVLSQLANAQKARFFLQESKSFFPANAKNVFKSLGNKSLLSAKANQAKAIAISNSSFPVSNNLLAFTHFKLETVMNGDMTVYPLAIGSNLSDSMLRNGQINAMVFANAISFALHPADNQSFTVSCQSWVGENQLMGNPKLKINENYQYIISVDQDSLHFAVMSGKKLIGFYEERFKFPPLFKQGFLMQGFIGNQTAFAATTNNFMADKNRPTFHIDRPYRAYDSVIAYVGNDRNEIVYFKNVEVVKIKQASKTFFQCSGLASNQNGGQDFIIPKVSISDSLGRTVPLKLNGQFMIPTDSAGTYTLNYWFTQAGLVPLSFQQKIVIEKPSTPQNNTKNTNSTIGNNNVNLKKDNNIQVPPTEHIPVVFTFFDDLNCNNSRDNNELDYNGVYLIVYDQNDEIVYSISRAETGMIVNLLPRKKYSAKIKYKNNRGDIDVNEKPFQIGNVSKFEVAIGRNNCNEDGKFLKPEEIFRFILYHDKNGNGGYDEKDARVTGYTVVIRDRIGNEKVYEMWPSLGKSHETIQLAWGEYTISGTGMSAQGKPVQFAERKFTIAKDDVFPLKIPCIE